jgi:hypothetical protein
VDIGRSFAFVFEDTDWIVKILIAAAILVLGILFSWVLLIPLILAALLLGGYSVEITRRVIHGDPAELPPWDNWGALLADGLKVVVIGIVYALPIIVVSICLGIPIGLVSQQDQQGWSSLLSAVLSCLSFLWSIVMSFLLPAAIAFWVARDDLGAAFRFGDVIAFVRDHLKTYLITFVMSWVASIIGSLGTIVCGVGWLVTAPYSWMVIGHLYGQAYLEASGQAPQPALQSEAA